MDASELTQLTNYGYFIAAMSTLLVYDFVVTYPKEILYMWHAPRSPGKVLYFLIRYTPFMSVPFQLATVSMSNPSPTTCRVMMNWFSWGTIIISFLGDAIVGLRTWAIWNRRPGLGIGLFLTWCGVVACTLYLIWVTLRDLIIEPSVPGVNGCLMVISTTTVAVSRLYVPLACYQALIFFATVLRGIRHLRHSRADLTTVLYRDAFMASAILFTLSAATVIVPVISSQLTISWNFATLYGIFNIIIPVRIMLNIREAAAKAVPTITMQSDESGVLRALATGTTHSSLLFSPGSSTERWG